MNLQKISALQLFYIMLGFEFGTAILFGLGAGAKQDSWLVILIAMLSSLVLMGVFTQLSIYYPDDTLFSMIPKIIGKYLSYPVIILYIFDFTYLAARASRDFGELIVSTILVETPILIVIGSFMVLMIYCLRGGVETFGRMGEAVFPIYILAMIIIWILLISVEGFNLKYLTPILGNGTKPILKEVYPRIINFPFGETIIIMIFFPYLNNNRLVRKVGLLVIFVGGFLLIVNSILLISVLGPEIYSKDLFPLLSATRLVSIADFLERFDVLVILMMVAGVFLKVGGFIFGSAFGICQLFKLKNIKPVLTALGFIITPLSLLIATDFIGHLEIGLEFLPGYVLSILHIGLPIFMLSIAFIRKKLNTKKLFV